MSSINLRNNELEFTPTFGTQLSFEVWSHMLLKPINDYVSVSGIDSVVLEYYNTEKKANETYRFGALAIRKTMAYYAERRLHKSKTVAAFPYSTGFYVAQEIYSAVAIDEMSLLAICDASLMSCNPGVAFVEILKDMKLTNYNPLCCKKTYDYAEQFILRKSGKSSLQLYATNAAIALQTFRQYFGCDRVFDREYKFICNSIRTAFVSKRQNPYYILVILETPLSYHSMDCLISRTKLPIMYDINDQGYVDNRYSQSDEPDYSIFRTMYELNMFFLHKGKTGSPVEYGCWLYFFCTEHKDKYPVKDRCWTDTWELANEDYLCPFAKLWHRWGLTGMKVKYHNPGME